MQTDSDIRKPESNSGLADESEIAQQHKLTAFQDELIFAVGRLEARCETPTGVAIRDQMKDKFEDKISSSRLYPNLDDLVEMGHLTKGAANKRANRYHLTPQGRKYVKSIYRRCEAILSELPY